MEYSFRAYVTDSLYWMGEGKRPGKRWAETVEGRPGDDGPRDYDSILDSLRDDGLKVV